MSAPGRSTRHFERLMRQALHEIGEQRSSRSRRRASRYLTPDQIDTVPVFDRGPAKAARPGIKRAPRPTTNRLDRLDRFRYPRPPRFKRYLQVRP